jgi:hypothetical protein
MTRISAAPITGSPSTLFELPTWRVNLMRGGYALMGVGLAVVKWPQLMHATALPALEGALLIILTAVSLLAFLGLRYPIAMLPLLVFEVLWKVLWLAVVGLPHLIADDFDASATSLLFSILFVIPVILVTPWDLVWRRFVHTPGDSWLARSRTRSSASSFNPVDTP